MELILLVSQAKATFQGVKMCTRPTANIWIEFQPGGVGSSPASKAPLKRGGRSDGAGEAAGRHGNSNNYPSVAEWDRCCWRALRYLCR